MNYWKLNSNSGNCYQLIRLVWEVYKNIYEWIPKSSCTSLDKNLDNALKSLKLSTKIFHFNFLKNWYFPCWQDIHQKKNNEIDIKQTFFWIKKALKGNKKYFTCYTCTRWLSKWWIKFYEWVEIWAIGFSFLVWSILRKFTKILCLNILCNWLCNKIIFSSKS